MRWTWFGRRRPFGKRSDLEARLSPSASQSAPESQELKAEHQPSALVLPQPCTNASRLDTRTQPVPAQLNSLCISQHLVALVQTGNHQASVTDYELDYYTTEGTSYKRETTLSASRSPSSHCSSPSRMPLPHTPGNQRNNRHRRSIPSSHTSIPVFRIPSPQTFFPNHLDKRQYWIGCHRHRLPHHRSANTHQRRYYKCEIRVRANIARKEAITIKGLRTICPPINRGRNPPPASSGQRVSQLHCR